MPYEISLMNLLKTRDDELYGRLLHIGECAKPLLSYTQGKFPYYTPHDFFHSEAVQENLEWLIPDRVKEGLNKHEIFFLLIAAWLHDWGMIGKAEEEPEAIRENHHVRTEDYFEKLHDKVGLNAHEARIAGRISKGHRKVDLYADEYDDIIIGQGIRIRTRFLSAVLRMADEADVTHSRTPEVIYYTLNPTDKSEQEFANHLLISGIGQLAEPHKVYLSAIARDPLGAKAIRRVASKIQEELNLVKSILSQHGIPLDTVELRLETRGFVDKPIGFEIDREKIFELLVGKHLYAKPDVAIRELVQNAVDSCNTRSSMEDDYSPSIILSRDENRILIEDDGVGMGFAEAKRFLSNIGSSYYTSEEFKDDVKRKPYDPISFFGIGFLSSFLIADGLQIETKKKDEDACLFTVSSLGKEWRYEKGSRTTPGTSITLRLNEFGRQVQLKASLERYFLCLDVPISYKEGSAEQAVLPSTWSTKDVVARFLAKENIPNPAKVETVTHVDTPEFDVILVHNRWRSGNHFRDHLVLFKQGIFIKGTAADLLDPEYCIFLNVKHGAIDLHLSREDVIRNEKWSALMRKVFDAILESITKADGEGNERQAIRRLSGLIEGRALLEQQEENVLFEKHPFLHSFFKKAPFPLVQGHDIQYTTLEEFMTNDPICVCRCASLDYDLEAKLLKDKGSEKPILLNPYRLPRQLKGTGHGMTADLVELLAQYGGKRYEESDLRTLLLSVAVDDNNDYSGIAPDYVSFASFGEMKPLCVVKELPQVSVRELHFGHGYWGNILLFWELLEPQKTEIYREALRDAVGDRYDSIKLIAPPKVALDSTDDFISAVLKRKEQIEGPNRDLVLRYFKYLAFLPLVMGNLTSALVFIEAIDFIENQISAALGIATPVALFNRLAPNARIYANYWDTYKIQYR